MGQLGSGAPAFPSCEDEDNSHAPPGPSASLRFVSASKTKFSCGRDGLAESELTR